jgi:CRISPR/Cas system-associated exonuclease Cas4 (RecB family)
MVNSYLICSMRFFYENVAKLPRLPSPVLALGSAFHETVRENAFQKVNTFEDLPEDLLTDFYRDDLRYRDVEWTGEESLDSTTDAGIVCIRDYRQNKAPLVQPAMVEYAFTVEVNGRGWHIGGKVDLITKKKVVTDHKTCKGQSKDPKPAHKFQIGVYTLAVRRLEGLEDAQAQIDYYPRGKPESYSRLVSFGEGLEKNVLSTFDRVADGIQKEVWIPNRTANYLCSHRYCDFANQCIKDCGGRSHNRRIRE